MDISQHNSSLMACKNWSVRWGWMRGNGGGKYSVTVVMSLRGGTICRHVNTPTLKSVMKLRKCVWEMWWKVNCALRVKLSHPYIGAHENNRLRDMRCVIRGLLEDVMYGDWRMEACSSMMWCTVVGVFFRTSCLSAGDVWPMFQYEIDLLVGPELLSIIPLTKFDYKN